MRSHSQWTAGAPNLRSATLSALKWNYAGAVAKFASQMAIGVVLARVLGPEPFGVVAAAWLVLGLGNLVADFGFGSALVQRQELDEEDIRAVFSIQLAVGVLLTGLVAGLAEPISVFFAEPSISKVLRVLSVVFIAQSFGITSVSLLRRDLNFRWIQTAQVASYLTGYLAVGIPLAYSGGGVWSLVVAQLIQSVLFAGLLYASVRHPLALSFRGRDVHRFGLKAFATNLANYSISNLASTTVGHVFGMTSLGLFNRAGTLLSTLSSNLTSVLQGVLFPAYSRAQERESASLRRVYLASLGAVALLMFPIGFTIAAVAPTVVTGLYGSNWMPTIPVLVPLALAMPFDALMSLNGPVIWGSGQVQRELKTQLLVAFIFGLMLLGLARVSLVAIAWGVAAMYVLRCVLMAWQAIQVVQSSAAEVLRSTLPGVAVAAATAATVYAVDLSLGTLGAGAESRLATDLVVGAATLVGSVLYLPSGVLSEELQGARARLLALVRARLNRSPAFATSAKP